MAPALTLHHGDQQAEYIEHPTERARRALMAAADVEDDSLALAMRLAARSLPRRERIMRTLPADPPAIMKGET
jgi:hypothetical protein